MSLPNHEYARHWKPHQERFDEARSLFDIPNKRSLKRRNEERSGIKSLYKRVDGIISPVAGNCERLCEVIFAFCIVSDILEILGFFEDFILSTVKDGIRTLDIGHDRP